MAHGFGLVRKADGTPRIDNPDKLHPAHMAMLTSDEREALGLWQGAWAVDAEGKKRLTKVAKGYEAVDALVAASEVYDGNKHYRLSQRVDVSIGGTLKIGE